MKIFLRIVGVLVALLLALFVLQLVASESGEVVVLTTEDSAGEPHQTRLWVVDHEGSAWLRAGAEVQAWYQRLLERPEVTVEREGRSAGFTAVPVAAVRPAINELMERKYGWADRFISLLFGREDAVPVRLDPRPQP